MVKTLYDTVSNMRESLNTEPSQLKGGRAFHRLVQHEWHLTAEGAIQDERPVILREGIGEKRAEEYVGWWGPDGRSEGLCVEEIAEWARRLGLEAVVWTALPSGLRDSPGEVPTSEAVVAYLRDLPAEPCRKAREYIRRAPPQIDTATRRLVEIELGWTHIRGDRVI